MAAKGNIAGIAFCAGGPRCKFESPEISAEILPYSQDLTIKPGRITFATNVRDYAPERAFDWQDDSFVYSAHPHAL